MLVSRTLPRTSLEFELVPTPRPPDPDRFESNRVNPKMGAADTVELHLPWSSWRDYVELQRALAVEIPAESERPTIHLVLRNSDKPPQKTIAILGGLGPLADANLLEQVIGELSGAQIAPSVEIQIYSNPHPPRKFVSIFSASAWIYMWDLVQFLRQKNVDEFILGSNTAHMQYAGLNWLSGKRLFNGVDHVARLLGETCATDSRILVLGTSAAAKAELYPKALANAGLNSVKPSSDQQALIQEAIEEIKSGRIAAGREHLKTALVGLRGLPFTHVLMACTELPLVIDPDFLRETLGYHCVLVNTATIFAKRIGQGLRNENT
jgi:aspartate racemase